MVSFGRVRGTRGRALMCELRKQDGSIPPLTTAG